MAYVPVPNVAQVEVRASFLGEQVENVYHFQFTDGTIDFLALQALVDAVGAAWITEMLPQLQGNYTLREVYGVDLTTVSGPAATYVAPASSDGALSGDPATGATCLCISLRTAKRGRGFRGRKYICGLRDIDIQGNVMLTGPATALLAAHNDFITAVETGTWSFGIVHRFENGVSLAEGEFNAVLSQLLVDFNIDSQRRRLAGRGT